MLPVGLHFYILKVAYRIKTVQFHNAENSLTIHTFKKHNKYQKKEVNFVF